MLSQCPHHKQCQPWPCRYRPAQRVGTLCRYTTRISTGAIAVRVEAESRGDSRSGGAKPATSTNAHHVPPVCLLPHHSRMRHQLRLCMARNKRLRNPPSCRRGRVEHPLRPQSRTCHSSRVGNPSQPIRPLPLRGQRRLCPFHLTVVRHQCSTQLGLVARWIAYSSTSKDGFGPQTRHSYAHHSPAKQLLRTSLA